MKKFIRSVLACLFITLPATGAPPSGDAPTPQLTIEMKDGSLILGTGLADPISFHSTAMGDLKMTWSQISSLEFSPTSADAKLTAANGDVYQVQSQSPNLTVITKFGQKDLPMKLIQSVKVTTSTSSAPEAKPEVTLPPKQQVTVQLADGSSVIGDLPTDPLAFHSATLGNIKIPWSTIATVSIDGDTMHLTAANGDQISGQLSFDTLHLNTSFGKLDLPVKTIRTITVTQGGANTAHLVGWWKLDEGAGAVAKDSNPGPNKHDGTILNNPEWAQIPGLPGTFLHLNADNQYVSLGNILQAAYPELSIACWEKCEGETNLQVIGERDFWHVPGGFALCIGGQNQVHFGSWDFSSNSASVTSSNMPRDHRWHHLVGTMARNNSGYTYKIYIDGQLNGTTNSTSGLIATTGGWLIGAQPMGPAGQWTFHGFLKDFRIYDCALSPAQVEAIYAEQPSLASISASLPTSPTPSNLTTGG